MRIRELRNLIAHEYAADKMAEIYEAVFILSPELGKIAEQAAGYSRSLIKRVQASCNDVPSLRIGTQAAPGVTPFFPIFHLACITPPTQAKRSRMAGPKALPLPGRPGRLA